MIRQLGKYCTFPKIIYAVTMQYNTRKDFENKLAQKKYYQILGLTNPTADSTKKYTEKDLHRAYLTQIKKFHSDNAPNETSKKDLQQISKCIIAAYDSLKKDQSSSREQPSQQTEEFKQEQQVSQALFGKKYEDIKHSLYATGNEHLRMKFINQLMKKKNIPNDDKYRQSKQQNKQKVHTAEPHNNNDKFLGVLFLCLLGLIPFIANKQTKKLEHKPELVHKQYTKQQIQKFAENSRKMIAKPFLKFFKSLYKTRPAMLTYPQDHEPHILQQLTKYSIAPDIHLYEVSPKYFMDPKQFIKLEQSNTVENIPKYQLTETKPNTLMSLSLEAQRVLQNVYVNVDQLLSQIKQTGKYTPPKVLFKFYGYMLVQLRQKPFSQLQNYRNTKYISLFDLYFDYYSPVFFKRDYYNQYLVGFDNQEHKNTRYFGNVHINHRSIPLRYIGRKQKVVIANNVNKIFNQFGKIKDRHFKYQLVWQNYYARFQKNWKNYSKHQINNNGQ